jgi:hypothetical protein
MRATLTLEQIIQEEIQNVFEQGATMRQIGSTSSKFNANKIAQRIYDAKGTFIDNESDALNAIKQIRNVKQYTAVLKIIQKLSGRGLAAYLKSFLGAKDLLEAAIHFYQVLPKSTYEWTVKKMVSYDDLKTALAVASGRSNLYNRTKYGELPGRWINQINTMMYDDALYNKTREMDAESELDGFDVSDILLRPFVSTEYYLEHDTWSSFINAPGGLRDMVYSPIGMGITTTGAMIPSVWTKVPVAVLFGILAIDDVSRIVDGDDAAWLDLLFDGIGIFTGAGGLKLLKPIGQKFLSLFKWIKNGGILARMSRGMFNVFFEIVTAISKTPLGRVLSSGAKAVNSMQSAIRGGIAKSLSFVKNLLTQLKNTMPDPIKRWASNALKNVKSMSVEYYMEELKPIFDAMRMVAVGVREFFRAPKIAVLALAQKMGISAKWVEPVVKPVATGVNIAWIAQLFTSIPESIIWWKNWYDTQMSEIQKQQWIKDVKQTVKGYTTKSGIAFYAFKNKPGTMITIYEYNKGYDPEWSIVEKKPIQVDSNTNGPLIIIGDRKIDGYEHITLPPSMTAKGEINDAWVKISDIVKIPV